MPESRGLGDVYKRQVLCRLTAGWVSLFPENLLPTITFETASKNSTHRLDPAILKHLFMTPMIEGGGGDRGRENKHRPKATTTSIFQFYLLIYFRVGNKSHITFV